VAIGSNDFGPLDVSKITINMAIWSHAKTYKPIVFLLSSINFICEILILRVFQIHSKKVNSRVTIGFIVSSERFIKKSF
jgi:hypothetical protein